MFSFWFIGFLASIVYHTFYGGMKSKTLFYRPKHRYEDTSEEMVYESERVATYFLISFGISLVWFIALPISGIYALGKRFAK